MSQGVKMLLVAYYAPPSLSGAGIAMYHLFSGVPSHKYVILTEQQSTNLSNIQGVPKLPVAYYYYSSSGINPLDNSTKEFEHGVIHSGLKDDSLLSKLLKVIRRLGLLRRIGQVIVIMRHIHRIVAAGSSAIRKEKPNLIVGYSDSGPVLIASYILSIKHRIPLSLFFYDLYKGNNLTPALAWYARIFEPLILRRAHRIFVMNELLRDVYQSRSPHSQITIIYNSLPQRQHRIVEDSNGNVPSIAYLGSIYWAQDTAVKQLMEAMMLSDQKLHLTLYTPHTPPYLHNLGIYETEYVKFTSCTPESAVQMLEKHHVTFLGLSHSTPYQLLINTSSPVRLCDYLQARVPMVIHAPSESFVVQHAQKYDFAFVSTSASPESLAKVIHEALTSNERNRKVANANHLAQTVHNPSMATGIFLESVHNTIV